MWLPAAATRIANCALWLLCPIAMAYACTQVFVEDTDPGAQCRFPSTGNGDSGGGGDGGVIRECRGSLSGLWCPTTGDYCSDGRYKWCPGTADTYGGTDPGRLCQFPFWYKGVEYWHCISRDSGSEGYLWCSTTPSNYSGRWTRCRQLPHLLPCSFTTGGDGIEGQCVHLARQGWLCLTARGDRRACPHTRTTEGGNDPGRSCSFPFKYNGVKYSECLHQPTAGGVGGGGERDADVDGGGYFWCGTTPNYDRDRLWTRCRRQSVFKLRGPLLLLAVLGGVLSGACGLACLAYCLCDRLRLACRLSARSWRRWRAQRLLLQRVSRRTRSVEQGTKLGVGDERTPAGRHEVTPSAPAPPALPPSYTEALLISAAATATADSSIESA